MAADSSDPTADDRKERSPDTSAPEPGPRSSDNQPSTDPADASASDSPATAAAADEPEPAALDSDRVDKGSDAADTAAQTDSDSTPYSPALIATAVALPIVLIVGVLVAAFIALRAPTEREPLALGPVPAPAADGPACQALLPALPADLGDYTKSTLHEPAPPATRAWQLPDGGDPIVLRCGLDRPLEFNRASPLQVIDEVQWFQVRDEVAQTGTWFAVDRETYIALTVPDGSGTAPVQIVSDTIEETLPYQEPRPGEL